MTNYICINGNKTELTEEQLKQLGIELPKASPFARVKINETYYKIYATGEICKEREDCHYIDTKHFEVGNYCTDKAIMEQRALHETLNRLLWRYSMEHDGDKIDWSTGIAQRKYNILYSDEQCKCEVSWIYNIRNIGAVYFISRQVAEAAIEEIIKPFMAAHPDFKF